MALVEEVEARSTELDEMLRRLGIASDKFTKKDIQAVTQITLYRAEQNGQIREELMDEVLDEDKVVYSGEALVSGADAVAGVDNREVLEDVIKDYVTGLLSAEEKLKFGLETFADKVKRLTEKIRKPLRKYKPRNLVRKTLIALGGASLMSAVGTAGYFVYDHFTGFRNKGTAIPEEYWGDTFKPDFLPIRDQLIKVGTISYDAVALGRNGLQKTTVGATFYETRERTRFYCKRKDGSLISKSDDCKAGDEVFADFLELKHFVETDEGLKLLGVDLFIDGDTRGTIGDNKLDSVISFRGERGAWVAYYGAEFKAGFVRFGSGKYSMGMKTQYYDKKERMLRGAGGTFKEVKKDIYASVLE